MRRMNATTATTAKTARDRREMAIKTTIETRTTPDEDHCQNGTRICNKMEIICDLLADVGGRTRFAGNPANVRSGRDY